MSGAAKVRAGAPIAVVRVKHCQEGGKRCLAGGRDGIQCVDGACDIRSGIRSAVTPSTVAGSAVVEAVALLTSLAEIRQLCRRALSKERTDGSLVITLRKIQTLSGGIGSGK